MTKYIKVENFKPNVVMHSIFYFISLILISWKIKTSFLHIFDFSFLQNFLYLLSNVKNIEKKLKIDLQWKKLKKFNKESLIPFLAEYLKIDG